MNTFIFDHSLEPITDWASYNDNMKADLTLPMLPPPKRFLTRGSVFNVSPETVYNFFQIPFERRPDNKHAVDVDVEKIRIYDDRIQLISIRYFFDRKKQVMSESKGSFKMLTYKRDSKKLYVIRNIKRANGRYKRSITNLSLCAEHIPMLSKRFMERWANALHDMIKKDVPDVIDNCDSCNNRIIALMLQHKIGKGIPGINDSFITNVSELASIEFIINTVARQEFNSEETLKKVLKYKRNTVYKFIPVLKKTNSTSKAFKVILGKEYYCKTLVKLLHTHNLNDEGHLFELLNNYDSKVPNSVKHLLKRYLSKDDKPKVEKLINNIIPMLRDVDDDYDDIISNWTKTMHRIDDVISWYLWRDTYEMSKELRLRVRPSRITSSTDVELLHGEYVRLLNIINNRSCRIGLPTEQMVFIKTNTPEVFKNYRFKQLLTANDLMDEGKYMGHCVASYANRCLSGSSIIFSVMDMKYNKLCTAEYSGSDYRLVQAECKVEGYKRIFPSPEFQNSILITFGNKLSKIELKEQLPYATRSALKEVQYNIEHLLFTNITEVIDEELAEIIDYDSKINKLNYKLEKIIEINKLIKENKPIDTGYVINFIENIDIDMNIDIHIPNNPQPATLVEDELDVVEEELLQDLNAQARQRCADCLFDNMEVMIQQVHDIVPF